MREEGRLVRRRKGKQTVLWSLADNGKPQRTKDEDNPSKTGPRCSTGPQKSEENGKRLVAGNSMTCPVENKPVPLSPPIYARAGTGFPQAEKKSGKKEAARVPRNPTVKLNRKTDCPDGNDTEVCPLGKTCHMAGGSVCAARYLKTRGARVLRGSNGLSSKWDKHHLDPTQRVLQARASRDPGAATTEVEARRQTIADAGWDTVERHGGLDAAVDRIDQAEEETPASAGAGWIDDFRLRGSRTWRRMGGHLSDGGWLTQVAHQVAHAFDHPNAPLSEGVVLAVVVQVVPGNPHWKRVGTDSPSALRQSVVRCRRRASPPRTARRGAAQEGEEVEGATPVFWPLVRHERVERWPSLWTPFRPSFSGSLPPQISLAGRPPGAHSRQ